VFQIYFSSLPRGHLVHYDLIVFLGKGKIHSRTGHEGTDGELMYSSTFSLTSALDRVGCQHHALAALPSRNTHCVEGWVGQRAPKNLASTVIRSPDSQVSIPNVLQHTSASLGSVVQGSAMRFENLFVFT